MCFVVGMFVTIIQQQIRRLLDSFHGDSAVDSARVNFARKYSLQPTIDETIKATKKHVMQ